MLYNTPLVLSVAQLNRYVKSKMDADENLNHIFLVGEISNFKHHTSGHLYFTLKDEEAQVRAVMFRSAASRLRFQVSDGMRVLVRGRVSLYEAGGSYQVFVDDMQPDGAGALGLAFEQLKEKLAREGLFDPAHKRALPKFPHTIGVITSETGAAVHEILRILQRRYPAAQVIFAPVAVQGEDAPAQMIAALETFNRLRCADVLILGRGGGSAEDLWAFNDEQLARAVYRSEIPVISAVGHETDFTICDFVADLRAPTPSAAAELAVPDRAALKTQLRQTTAELQKAMTDTLSERRSSLALLCSRGAFSQPQLFFDEKRMRLLTLCSTFQHVQQTGLHAARVKLGEMAAKLQSLSPLAVLSRGYALASDPGGRPLKSVTKLHKDDRICVRLTDGTATCAVLDTQLLTK